MRTRILLLIKTGRIYQEDLRGSCPARPLRRLTLPCWTGDGLAGDNFDGRLPTPITRGRDATTDFTCSRDRDGDVGQFECAGAIIMCGAMQRIPLAGRMT